MSAVISVTTIPDRIERIGPCLQSLVVQGLPVYLWAVEKIARSETRMGSIPDFPGVCVEVVSDRGPITKLLPALERGFDIILTADDDCIYGEGWASGLLAWAEKLPDAALGYRGRVLRGTRYKHSRVIYGKRIKKARTVDIITGVSGALYRRSFFGEGIYEEWRRWPTNDDLVITAHLKRRGVSRYVVPSKCRIASAPHHKHMPLYTGNSRGGNDRGMKVLGLIGRPR